MCTNSVWLRGPPIVLLIAPERIWEDPNSFLIITYIAERALVKKFDF
jgi:hypothetical protein